MVSLKGFIVHLNKFWGVTFLLINLIGICCCLRLRLCAILVSMLELRFLLVKLFLALILLCLWTMHFLSCKTIKWLVLMSLFSSVLMCKNSYLLTWHVLLPAWLPLQTSIAEISPFRLEIWCGSRLITLACSLVFQRNLLLSGLAHILCAKSSTRWLWSSLYPPPSRSIQFFMWVFLNLTRDLLWSALHLFWMLLGWKRNLKWNRFWARDWEETVVLNFWWSGRAMGLRRQLGSLRTIYKTHKKYYLPLRNVWRPGRLQLGGGVMLGLENRNRDLFLCFATWIY